MPENFLGVGAWIEVRCAVGVAFKGNGRHRDDRSGGQLGLKAVVFRLADWEDIGSGESYVGYGHGDSPVSPDGLVADRPHDYTAPAQLALNEWGLSGTWTIREEGIRSGASNAHILFRFHAPDVHLVMGPSEKGATVPFRTLIDGKPPNRSCGTDVDADGNGAVTEQRLYRLVRQMGPIVDREVEIEFLAPGAEAFVFTFG